MTPLQRALAAGGGVILEGRNTGSVVCPTAAVKFYVDAALETRARRRQGDLRRQGIATHVAAVAEVVTRRDREDSGARWRRSDSPRARWSRTPQVSPDEVVE